MASITDSQANTIETVRLDLTGILDELVASETVTGYMTPNPQIVQAGSRAGEFRVATVSTDGLGDYDKASGFPVGAITSTFETYKCTYDRGREFVLDSVDVLQTDGLMTASYAMSEFVRTKVVPEIDAVRLCTVAETAVDAGQASEDTPTAANFLSGIIDGIQAVKSGLRLRNTNGIMVHISDEYIGLLDKSTEYTKSKDIAGAVRRLDTGVDTINGATVVETPADYMGTGITVGSDGFTKSGDVAALVVAPGIANGLVAHNIANIFPAGVAQRVDGSIIDYRVLHDCIVLKNKTKGVYAVGAGSS